MPRRRSRFSTLRKQMRVLGGVPPATSPLKKYHEYITGQTTFTVPNAIDGEARKRYAISVVPFAVSATADTGAERYQTEITAYSYKGLITRASVGLTAFGISTSIENSTSDASFYPALIKASYSKDGADPIPDKTSGMTGFKYSYTPKRSFSFPFGRTIAGVSDAEEGEAETSIANADELDVANSLKRSLSSAPGTGGIFNSGGVAALGVSYEPELFKPADTAPTLTGVDLEGITVT